jgi:hypothetical protein
VDPPLQTDLILLCRGTSTSFDDTSVSLSTILGAAWSFPLSEPRSILTPPWPPAMTALGISMPRDSSPLCHTMMLISSSVGSSLNSLVYIA